MHRIKKTLSLFAGLLVLALAAGCANEAQRIEYGSEDTAKQAEKQNVPKSTQKVTENESWDIDTELVVTFLDVGEGNAVLVEQDGRYMLIDGGDREFASFVVSYLKDAGVQELEYVIASHYDADHLNGVVGALNVFPCQRLLAADYTTDTKVYESFCEVVEEQDITLVYPAMGEQYTFGDARFTIVCPDAYDYDEPNDNSIGIRLEYGNTSFLICGDAGIEVEEMMLSSGLTLDSDVYLASHHGSEYSSSYAFLQAVSPEVVVISVGADNSYGHPTKRVLDDIAAVGADVYRTDELGTIRLISDGSMLTVDKEIVDGDEILEVTGSQTDMDMGTDCDIKDESEVAAEGKYIMNQNTKKFHLPSCGSAEEISEDNRAEFTGCRDELIAAGYEPCKRCNP